MSEDYCHQTGKPEDGCESASIEILFNSVEVELARRWAHGEVPAIFASRPAEDLRRMVKAWWHIYHESICAANGRDRTIWDRNPAYPAEALDTAALIAGLQQIYRLMNIARLRDYRPSLQHEISAIHLLGVIRSFYIELSKHQPASWKQIL